MKQSINLRLLYWITSFAVLIFCPLAQSSHPVQIKVDGILYLTFSLDSSLLAMDTNGTVSIKVMDPHLSEERVYKGVPFRGLLESLTPSLPNRPLWDSYEAIMFECEDGYNAIIPMSRFLEFDGYLAYDSADYLPFELENKLQNEQVDLGSYYLVWDNEVGEANRVPPTESWPYQVTGIHLITSISKSYPSLVPDKDEPANVAKGMDEFTERCLPCHSIKGSGSKKAPDLAGVFDRHHITELQTYIENPIAINPDSHMPGLDRTLTDLQQEKLINHYLIPYLKSVTK